METLGSSRSTIRIPHTAPILHTLRILRTVLIPRTLLKFSRISQLAFFSRLRRLRVSGEPQGIQLEFGSEISAQVCLNSDFYSREAVLRASYWYTDVAFIHVPESPAGKLLVCIRLKHKSPTLENPKAISIEELVGEFCNSVLDFELRRQVESETAPVRQLILAKAFSESGILEDNPPGSVADPVANANPDSLIKITNGTEDEHRGS